MLSGEDSGDTDPATEEPTSGHGPSTCRQGSSSDLTYLGPLEARAAGGALISGEAAVAEGCWSAVRRHVPRLSQGCWHATQP